MSDLKINRKRFEEDFQALSRIGSTLAGGVHRPALSPAHIQARAWFCQRAVDAGLTVRIDGAGNHSAILPAKGASQTILIGSHLDSVPNGGRFDGGLGVVAALEVIRTIKEAGLNLTVNLEAIDFTDEESTHVVCMGSRALAGRLSPGELQTPVGGRRVFEEGLQAAGINEAEIVLSRRDPASLAGYLELHIEQGPRLSIEGKQIGIVTGIVGIRTYLVTFHGNANHAGSTPMNARSDAGLGASSFVLAAREIVLHQATDCVANIGNLIFSPGAFNVIPGEVAAYLEI